MALINGFLAISAIFSQYLLLFYLYPLSDLNSRHNHQLYFMNLSINFNHIIDFLQHVMSQIANLRQQENEKLRVASNFTIWASVLHFKASPYGGVVQGYIKSGAWLCADIVAEIVKAALDTISHTLVTGVLFPEVLKDVLHNGWNDRKVIVQLDTLR